MKANALEQQVAKVPAWFETARYVFSSVVVLCLSVAMSIACPASRYLTRLALHATFRLLLIFAVFLLLRYLWNAASVNTPRYIPFQDPELIHPSVLRRIRDKN